MVHFIVSTRTVISINSSVLILCIAFIFLTSGMFFLFLDFHLVIWCLVIGSQKQKQYFVGYKGLSHVHNHWVPESQLILEAPLLVSKFNGNNQVK